MKAIFLTFILAPLLLLSQNPAELINDMKDGVILVRLMTRENAIKALKDADLSPAPEAEISSMDKFFISEFGNVEPTDEKYFTHYSLEESEEGGKEIRSNYGGDTEIGTAALVIRDDSFRQLWDPFPFYVRTREGLPWKRSKAKTVEKMNEALHNYLEKQ